MTYKNNFDQLGNRFAEELTSETYVNELVDALFIAAVIAIPFVFYFWS
jgi:hypothetical protein